jgi:prevent-host-death family protein
MPTAIRTIASSTFKAKCLGLLDEVARTGHPITVTKRGRPVARVVPIQVPEPVELRGSVQYDSEADLLAPEPDVWGATR